MASELVCCTLPRMTWSTSPAETPPSASAAFEAITARSIALIPLKAPERAPNGVRLAATIQISLVSFFMPFGLVHRPTSWYSHEVLRRGPERSGDAPAPPQKPAAGVAPPLARRRTAPG